jgi:hypothetical protein
MLLLSILRIKTFNLNFKPNLKTGNQMNTSPNFKNLIYFTIAILLIVAFADQLNAIQSDTLRAPLQEVKKEVWSYMFAIKTTAVVVGSIFAVMKQSVMPFGIGAGIFAGAQFFDTVIGDGAAALIG